MQERFWQSPDDRKSETLPEPYRSFIRRYDKIELHRAKAALLGPLQRMRAHRPSNTFTRRLCSGNIATIRDVRTATPLIRLKEIRAENRPVFLENEHLMPIRQPICPGICARNVKRNGVRLACPKNRLNNVENRLGIGRRCQPNQG